MKRGARERERERREKREKRKGGKTRGGWVGGGREITRVFVVVCWLSPGYKPFIASLTPLQGSPGPS